MARIPTPKSPKQVAALAHEEATRKNIPTAELQTFLDPASDVRVHPPVGYSRAQPLAEGGVRVRDADLDPQIIWNGARIKLTPAQVQALVATGEVSIGDAQLVWRGKDQQDWSDLIVQAPPIYVQEKIKPQAIIADLQRHSGSRVPEDQLSMFADFNGIDPEAKTEFYEHDQHWSNRMILGDSLQVMASLAEREALRGQVQCIYFDPPYGIKFNSNWQVSTQSRDVKDGKQTDISREPEQVKAFRDTWKDGIHSYLTYLRDRLTVARELLTESGSIFVQIGDENVHRVRMVMDEVFGADNFISEITLTKAASQSSSLLASINDYILFYARTKSKIKYRQLFDSRAEIENPDERYICVEDPSGLIHDLSLKQKLGFSPIPPGVYLRMVTVTSQSGSETSRFAYSFEGANYRPPGARGWSTNGEGLTRLKKAGRMWAAGAALRWKNYHADYAFKPIASLWSNLRTSGFGDVKVYIVQTLPAAVGRCILMATDPGDLVLDPTCGSGTTAYVAEQWGRRWITVDTSRVALALARTRLMSARYPYYLLADSGEGRRKEQEVSGKPAPSGPIHGDVRQGFVYDRAPHVTLKSIANNAEIDLIWERWQATLEPLRAELNRLITKSWEEWEVPREPVAVWPEPAHAAHKAWWEARVARQREIDASIAKAADVELLFDRPYEDKAKVRVAGPFTVESLSPHRIVPSDLQDIGEETAAAEGKRRRALEAAPPTDFAAMVLENLKTSGVQGRDRGDKVLFASLAPWPGKWIGCAGTYMEGEHERRVAVFIGPEFGTCSRPDLVAAAREAMDARFDILVACAFAYEANASELTKLGPLDILQAKMNPDLHMADDLKNTGKGNLFVVFGEPDIEIERLAADKLRVRVKGVDVFDPNTGDIRSDDTAGIAAWFIDTDYDEESFFVRQAYFLGANDPYKSLKTALKAEVDEAAWSTLYRDVSRPFDRPDTGRIAVKVINHFGDEVMKVYGV